MNINSLRFFGVLNNKSCNGSVTDNLVSSFFITFPIQHIRMIIDDDNTHLEFESKRVVNINDTDLYKITFFEDNIELPLAKFKSISFLVSAEDTIPDYGVSILYSISTI